jgi:hypothetical protein
MLKDKKQNILYYELFYNLQKAQKAYKKASKADETGTHMLWGENGGAFGRGDVVAEIRYFGESVPTSENPGRKSFLNLSDAEIAELADLYDLPSSMIIRLSNEERRVAEGQRGYGESHNEKTLALSRKYLPSILHSIFRKL